MSYSPARLEGKLEADVTGAEWENTPCPGSVNSDANGDTCCRAFTPGQPAKGCPIG